MDSHIDAQLESKDFLMLFLSATRVVKQDQMPVKPFPYSIYIVEKGVDAGVYYCSPQHTFGEYQQLNQSNLVSIGKINKRFASIQGTVHITYPIHEESDSN